VDNGGTRSSTSAAYLPAEVYNRPNLHILTSTLVTRLVLEDANAESTVKSVEIAQKTDGQRYHVRANKEVLVCLGSIGSPQLLLASGIGPKDELEKVGVKSKIDLRGVGKDMKDHPACPIPYKTKPGSSGQYLVESDLKSVSVLVGRQSFHVDDRSPPSPGGCTTDEDHWVPMWVTLLRLVLTAGSGDWGFFEI